MPTNQNTLTGLSGGHSLDKMFDLSAEKTKPVTNLSPNHKVKPALCLDFDGTIRRSKSGETFINNAADIELMPGVEKLIWRYREMGYVILGISNQAGVAHGRHVDDREPACAHDVDRASPRAARRVLDDRVRSR